MTSEALAPQQKERVLDRLPYLTVLMLDIRDINIAIHAGYSGKDEADCLLSDLKPEWAQEVNAEIQQVSTILQKKLAAIPKTGANHDIYREKYAHLAPVAKKEYAHAIKKIIIKLLSDKNLLLQATNTYMEAEYSIYNEEKA